MLSNEHLHTAKLARENGHGRESLEVIDAGKSRVRFLTLLPEAPGSSVHHYAIESEVNKTTDDVDFLSSLLLPSLRTFLEQRETNPTTIRIEMIEHDPDAYWPTDFAEYLPIILAQYGYALS